MNVSDANLAALLLTNRIVELGEKPLSAAEFWALCSVVSDPSLLLGMPSADIAEKAGLTLAEAQRYAALLAGGTAFAFERERRATGQQRGVSLGLGQSETGLLRDVGGRHAEKERWVGHHRAQRPELSRRQRLLAELHDPIRQQKGCQVRIAHVHESLPCIDARARGYTRPQPWVSSSNPTSVSVHLESTVSSRRNTGSDRGEPSSSNAPRTFAS